MNGVIWGPVFTLLELTNSECAAKQRRNFEVTFPLGAGSICNNAYGRAVWVGIRDQLSHHVTD